MDNEEVLARMSALSIDWSSSPARIREELMRNGCKGISEKRIRRLKSEHLDQKSSSEVKSDPSVQNSNHQYENEDEASVKLKRLHQKGKNKGRYFEKALPNVASALRSGELKSEHAANVLTSRYMQSKEPIELIPGTDIQPHEMILTHLTNETFTLGHSRKFNTNKCYQFLCDLQSRFDNLQSKLPQLETSIFRSFTTIGGSLLSSIQQAYDETCSVWETRLDRHFKKGDGYFQRTCSLYQCAEAEFITWLASKLSSNITPDMVSKCNKQMEDLLRYHKSVALAAREVEEGKLCWKCNTQQNIIQHKSCARCQCAVYCSVQCQKADWKKHKVVCVQLRDKRREVNSALPLQHSQSDQIEGNKKERNQDVEAMVKYWLAIRAEHHGGGSLENFYKRLDRVLANEWWLEPNNDDSGETPCQVDESSIRQFLMLCFYMARSDDNLSVEEFRTRWCPSPVLMTRAAFLFVYKCFSVGENEASRNEMYSRMRTHFCKAAQSLYSGSEDAVIN